MSTSPHSSATTASSGRRIRGLDATQRAQQRRDLLLDTALELFARDGYSNTSIETLCQAAYVGNKAFYEHFSTKEACYLELLQRNTHTLMAGVAAAVETMPSDEAQATAHLVSAFVDALLADPRIPAVTFGQAAGISPTIERQRRANRRQAAELVRGAWRRFGIGPEDQLAHLSVAVIGGVFDLVADVLDRTDYAPGDDDSTELKNHVIGFVTAVRSGLVDTA